MLDYELPTRIVTQQDLIDSGCFDVEAAISISEDAFLRYANGEMVVPDKICAVFDKTSQSRINCLPAAILQEKIYGMKWVSVFPENPEKYQSPNLTAVIILSELERGYPIAFMEGSMCSNLRTAAISAVAAKYLARKDSRSISFIGAGEQAKSHFLSIKSVLPDIEICRVASRTQASEQLFVQQMKRFYPLVQFIPCSGDYRKATASADVIVTAISGQEKILQADWVKEGAFYCHVAGLEDDFGVARKADKIVCDNWDVVKHRTQTISQMYQQGLLVDSDIYADLHEIVAGWKKGRENETDFIYFNSVGMSYVDISLALWMYKKAIAAGKGTLITMKNRSMFDIE